MTKATALEGEHIPAQRIEHIGDIMDLSFDDFVVFVKEFPQALVGAYAAVSVAREQGATGKGRDILPSISWGRAAPGEGGVAVVNATTGEKFDLVRS